MGSGDSICRINKRETTQIVQNKIFNQNLKHADGTFTQTRSPLQRTHHLITEMVYFPPQEFPYLRHKSEAFYVGCHFEEFRGA